MLRKFIFVSLFAIVFSAVDANSASAQVNRGVGRGLGRRNQTNNLRTRIRRGLMRIQVRTPEGRAAGGATVRISTRGGRGIVRRTNGRGLVEVAVPAGSHVIRARGRGGNRGAVTTSVAPGRTTGVTVQLHGHARLRAHLHELHGLGLHHLHRFTRAPHGTARGGTGTPGATKAP